jgi:hypothetical protein
MTRWGLIDSLLFVLLVSPASAQVTRVGGTRSGPQLTTGDTLAVSATPSAVSFALVSGGVAPGSSSILVTTSWTGSFASIEIYASFSSPGAALSGGSPVVQIPSSCVLGKDSTGIPVNFTAFTESNPLGGAGDSLNLYSVSNFSAGSRTDSLSLNINLSGMPQLPAGSYSGVLLLQAQAL